MAARVQMQYTREMRTQFGYTAAWLPNVEVRLGDVGLLRNYEYVRVASLADFGLAFEHRLDRASALLEYSSADAVSLSLKAAGSLPGLESALTTADAGMAVSFSSDGAVLFQAANCTTAAIADQRGLADQLVALSRSGDWPDDYVVVTQVISAERVTVLVSSAGGAVMEFSANAEANLGIHSLVDAKAGLRAVRSRNLAVQIVGQGGMTPLFQAWGVSHPWLRGPRVVRRGESTEVSRRPEDAAFGEVDYEVFAD